MTKGRKRVHPRDALQQRGEKKKERAMAKKKEADSIEGRQTHTPKMHYNTHTHNNG